MKRLLNMKEEPNEAIIRIIVKDLAENADQEEKDFLKKWIGESDENRNCFEQLRNIWEASESQKNLNSVNTNEALADVLRRISGRSFLNKLWNSLGRIAAILFIPLLLGNILWITVGPKEDLSAPGPVYSEVFATFGTRTALKLIDGSLVWLNSGSSLKYPDKFTGNQREVTLNGEAYFEVTSNPDIPFIVKTSDLTVKATGTKFNVMSYISDSKSEITLVTGKVFVSESDKNGSVKPISELSPNQHMVFNGNTKSFSINDEDTYKYYAWKDGKLIFRNEPLSDVVKKISQVFNVDIELQGKELQDYRYRATFEDESLSEILKLLKISSPICYRELKRTPLPDGSFPKKKVIISPVNQK